MTNSKIQKIALLFSLLFFANESSGAIDLRESSFSHSATELSLLTRHYHSRSNRPGLIGYGWCFAFEAQIIRLSEHRWRLYECGSRSELTDFVPAPGQKGVWMNPNQPDDRFIVGVSEIARPARSQVFYRKSGNLKSFTTESGAIVTLTYGHESQIKGLRVSDGRSFRFFLNPHTQLIERVVSDKGEVISYLFDNQNLIGVKKGQEALWRYTYDEFHNLTEVHQVERKIAALKYDTASDRVIEFQNEHGCRERYSYKEIHAIGEETFIADIERTCRRREKSKTRFQFFYLELNSFRRSLAQMTIETEEEKTIISFDRETGHTLSVEKLKNLRRL